MVFFFYEDWKFIELWGDGRSFDDRIEEIVWVEIIGLFLYFWF